MAMTNAMEVHASRASLVPDPLSISESESAWPESLAPSGDNLALQASSRSMGKPRTGSSPAAGGCSPAAGHSSKSESSALHSFLHFPHRNSPAPLANRPALTGWTVWQPGQRVYTPFFSAVPGFLGPFFFEIPVSVKLLPELSPDRQFPYFKVFQGLAIGHQP